MPPRTPVRAYGIAAITAGLIMLLVILVTTIVGKGTGAFQQTFVTLEVELLESKLDKKGERNIEDIKKVTTFGYAPIIKGAMEAAVAEYGIEPASRPRNWPASCPRTSPPSCATT